MFFENSKVKINLEKFTEFDSGKLALLAVEHSPNDVAIVFFPHDINIEYKISIQINSICFKEYTIKQQDVFYVILKRTIGFFEIEISSVFQKDKYINTLSNLEENGSINIIKPRITLYSICWNEEKILPFFLQHYSKFVDKIIIFDNESTDDSIKIIQEFNECSVEIISYSTNNKIDDRKYLEIKNNCWKSDPSEYVIVCDSDEFLASEYDILEYLSNNTDIDVFTPTGFEMISEVFPNQSESIIQQVLNGRPHAGLNKRILFRPNMIFEIGYSPGCHINYPVGINLNVKESNLDLIMLHYKCLSLDYFISRTAILGTRLSDFNLNVNAGSHYLLEDSNQINIFNQILLNSTQVVSEKIIKRFEKRSKRTWKI
jgi:glycosyltransferase involved in cell wall biosynthesis